MFLYNKNYKISSPLYLSYINPSILFWLNRLKLILPFRGYPQNRNEDIRPFFIIGSGRSGNTLLRRVLFNHSQLHIPPETYVLAHIIRLFNLNKNMAWKDIVYLVFAQFAYHPEFETFNISLRPLVKELVEIPQHKRSLAYILDRFYLYHAAQHHIECRRWGDKTPINTFYLNWIVSVFPKSQFIHILRDGCDVAASYYKTGIYDDISAAGMRWVNSVKAAQRFMKSRAGQCIELRYENFVTHPEKTVRQVCDFLDVDFEAGMLEADFAVGKMGDVGMRPHHEKVTKDISSDSVGAGREKLTVDQKKKLDPLMTKLLKKLGYAPCIS